jgi:hypothetical protein
VNEIPYRGSTKEVVVERQLRVLAAMASMGVVAWSVTAGASVASASTRLRSGTLHAQLVSRVSPGAHSLPSGLTVRGAGVMATIVGVLAVLALTFLIVTFIRRRVTAA